MRRARNKGSPPVWRKVRSRAYWFSLAGCLIAVAFAEGCKSEGWKLAEIRGKNQFGPEFQHDEPKNVDQIRYYAGQQVEFKFDNGWTTALTYRYRKVQEGTGNTENLVLLEVGYPIWKKPKKADKSAEQIETLERQIQELRATLPQKSSENVGLVESDKQDTEVQRVAVSGEASAQKINKKENDHEKP